MGITRKHTNERMSQIVVHNGIVYTAGQVAFNNKGGEIGVQTREVLGAIEAYLVEAGSDKEHMLSASVWLTNASDLEAFNLLWDEWVPDGCAPARACVITDLVSPDFIVEVAVTAAVKE